MTCFQLIVCAGHCFDLAVKQIIMSRQAGVSYNELTYKLCLDLKLDLEHCLYLANYYYIIMYILFIPSS